MARRKSPAGAMALGGVLAALAIVIMCLGGMIPVATYVCPMLCMLLLAVVDSSCGSRVAWAWYGAVSILALLMGPDKEAAAVFVFLGYYPILKRRMDRMKFRWLWKLGLFNGAILSMYWLLMHLFGMDQLGEEFREMGRLLTVVMLLAGNLIFFLIDRILQRFSRRK